MKILKISGRNLASLAGDFGVDFEQEPLASSGLFAISGPTGAGKTTLLDALCLALYNATPRLLKVVRGASFLPDVGTESIAVLDPRTLLRRGAAEGFAEVDFVGNDGHRYRARWSVRRARGKAAGGLQKSALTLHQLPDLAPLGGTNTEVADEIVRRIGLTFEQFTRAVLLAQNEFSAFLKTEENERGELLETLTGSTVYSAISRRAFERFRAEQAALQQLSARLADHTPLAAEERTALEAQCAAADSALAAADAAQKALELLVRWHQEAAKLQAAETDAVAALALAEDTAAGASARRQTLATLDAIEPARALLADCRRLEREHAAAGAVRADAASGLQHAQTLHAEVRTAHANASAALAQAERALHDARPALDQAKALDAALAALAPSHQQATAACQAARQEHTEAAEALAAADAQLAASRAAGLAAAAWLAAHGDLAPLAAAWPRWDTLLTQAAQARQQAAVLSEALAAAHSALHEAQAAEAAASAALATSAARLQALEQQRQQALAALAAHDADGLRSQRAALETRRDSLHAAHAIAQERAASGARLIQLDAQAAALAQQHAAAQAALAAAEAQAGGLGAALAQSERSLASAELACAGNVVDLRATLQDGQPCPVCGSAEHPYHQRDPQIEGMLDALRAEVARCRRAAQDNLSLQAAERSRIGAGEQQMTALAHERAALAQAHAAASTAWQALPLAADAGADALAWLTQQTDLVRSSLQQLERSDSALRAAASARDSAQQACDQMAAQHAASQQQASAAHNTLAAAAARHAALHERQATAARALDQLLEQLDAAFAAGWRGNWAQDPARFHSTYAEQVQAWTGHRDRQAQLQAAIATGQADHAAALRRSALAQQLQQQAAERLAKLDAGIGAQRAQRAALFDGRPVQAAEQDLGSAIEQARVVLAAQQAAMQQAGQNETRALEALAQAGLRLQALQAEAAAATAQLDGWLAAPGQPLHTRADLEALLAHERSWIAAERAALQAIDAAAARAATVLSERRARRALHQQAAPPSEVADPEAALAAHSAARAGLLDAASALRLQLAQDDVRRTNAHTMLAEIGKQQAVEQRWARLNELIGSSDGKKFRNYAQQFTLDVLLGYANSHLHHLARRYRLERVVAASGPSLGLLVRDQDMGGEIRSVNSLSGGESFLVSLALALGLASLSSNRVRVESLFIDEGFGSLDSETLRVAMDALDGLQAMGRKVGVISHVQEMTERIATKILVQPAGGGTSTVTVQ